MDESNRITDDEINSLLEYFSKNTYQTNRHGTDSTCQTIFSKVLRLMGEDYQFVRACNSDGELCNTYPAEIIIIEKELQGTNSEDDDLASYMTVDEDNLTYINNQNHANNVFTCSTGDRLRNLFENARCARCRARFPIPVIFYDGKYICRSSTLSGNIEVITRSGMDYVFDKKQQYKKKEEDKESVDEKMQENSEESIQDAIVQNWVDSMKAKYNMTSCNEVRIADKALLNFLKVESIIDLMVEKKKMKYGFPVSSSEKVDKENRYSEFNLISMPYPGCEFFKLFRDNNYDGLGLIFDWTQGFIDAELGIPDHFLIQQHQIDWKQYKTWDLIKLTQNYLRFILHHFVDKKTGSILIHCISGWDRTPLFISLLRLSLWADGLIHKNLSADQILYLTIAYDWLFFSHNLSDRLSKGEDIFFFCFYVLKFLFNDEFSVLKSPYTSPTSTSSTIVSSLSKNDLDSQACLESELVFSQDSNNSLDFHSASSINSKSEDTPLTVFEDDDNGNNVPSPYNLNNCDMCGELTCSFMLNGNGTCDNTLKKNSDPTAGIVSNTINLETNGSLNGNHYTETNGNFNERTIENPMPCGSQNKKHTSPVPVPSSNKTRRRHDSSTSIGGVDGWQLITDTGSYNSSLRSDSFKSRNSFSCDGGVLTDSTTTIKEDCFIYCIGTKNNSTSVLHDAMILRKEKLRQVRELFYKKYCNVVGLKVPESEGCISNLFGNLANSVTKVTEHVTFGATSSWKDPLNSEKKD